jgi:hypothetical protein
LATGQALCQRSLRHIGTTRFLRRDDYKQLVVVLELCDNLDMGLWGALVMYNYFLIFCN